MDVTAPSSWFFGFKKHCKNHPYLILILIASIVFIALMILNSVYSDQQVFIKYALIIGWILIKKSVENML